MVQSLRLFVKRRSSLPGLSLAFIMVGGLGLGLWASQPGPAQAADDRKSSDHGVSERVWVTEKEIKDRYPSPGTRSSCAGDRQLAQGRGRECKTGGAFGAVIVDRDGTWSPTA